MSAPLNSGPNPIAPDLMTSDERLDEVSRLLVGGMLRLRKRRKKLERSGERALELSAKLSPDGTGETGTLKEEETCRKAS